MNYKSYHFYATRESFINQIAVLLFYRSSVIAISLAVTSLCAPQVKYIVSRCDISTAVLRSDGSMICKRGGQGRAPQARVSRRRRCRAEWGVGRSSAPSPEKFFDFRSKMSTSSALWALFLQFSYLLYKQETLFLGLQNLLLQPACNAQHRDSKRRQKQAYWKVKTFYKQPP